MGWFLRKSLRLGPLRLNVSRRGVGASVGVKGLRAGVDASGKPYVAGGRGGIYFRERLRTAVEKSAEPAARRGWAVVAWTVAIVLATLVLLLVVAR